MVLITYCTDEGQVEDGAEDRYSSDKANDDWEETPARDESDRESKEGERQGHRKRH